jgi:hypothetical protein
MMKPEGSLLPGMMIFAMRPAKNPTMMVQIMLIFRIVDQLSNAAASIRQNRRAQEIFLIWIKGARDQNKDAK